MNNCNNISFKVGRIVARLFIPVLWPVRFLIVMPLRKLMGLRKIRRLRAWVSLKRYMMRLQRAKKTAAKRNTATGKKQFGVKIGMYVMVWNRFELMNHSKVFGKKLGKPFDYRKFAVFTYDNGKITEI